MSYANRMLVIGLRLTGTVLLKLCDVSWCSRGRWWRESATAGNIDLLRQLLHLVVEKDRPAGVVIQRTGDLCAAFFKVEAY